MLIKTTWLAVLRVCVVIVCLLPCSVLAAAPPNIVMIISDDQAWTDYGFMGHPQIRTPHLDRLAAASVVFKRGYVPTALCRPSLMSMITGRSEHSAATTGSRLRKRM